MRAADARPHVLRWFIAAVLAAFVAGMAIGAAGTTFVAASGAVDDDRTSVIVRNLVDRYGLSREQARQVRLVFQARDSELQAILSRDRSKLPDSTQQKISDAQYVAEERIRNVLNAEQRRRYLQDSVRGPAAESPRPDPGSDRSPDRNKED